MIPEERLLWSAIIAQAVKDAKSEAIAWIFGEDTGFEIACDWADTHPEWVRRMVYATPSRVPRRAAGGWKARKTRPAASDFPMLIAA